MQFNIFLIGATARNVTKKITKRQVGAYEWTSLHNEITVHFGHTGQLKIYFNTSNLRQI